MLGLFCTKSDCWDASHMVQLPSFKRNAFHWCCSTVFYAMLSLYPIPAANVLSDTTLRVLTCRCTQQQILDFILSLQLSISFYIKISLELHVLCAFIQVFLFFFRLSTWKRYVNASPGNQLAALAQGSTLTSLGLQRRISHSSVAQMLWTGERQQRTGLRYINMAQVSILYLNLWSRRLGRSPREKGWILEMKGIYFFF